MNTFLILAGIAGLIGAFVAPFFFHRTKLGISLGVLGLVLLILSDSFAIIPTGYTGVKSAFGQISEKVMPKGFNWKMPFVEEVKTVNNKQQKKSFEDRIWGESSEKVQVYGEFIDVIYQINEEKSAWLYANVEGGTDDLITNGDVSSSVKDAMNQLPAETVTNRGYIEPLAAEMLNKTMAVKYGEGTVRIIAIKINQMDFEDAYNQALAQKAVAQQQREEAAIKNQENIERAEAEKKAAITKAEGEAESKRIEAQAAADARRIQVEAEAEANRKINETTTDTVLKNKFYNVWNGQLPKVMGEGTVITNVGE